MALVVVQAVEGRVCVCQEDNMLYLNLLVLLVVLSNLGVADVNIVMASFNSCAHNIIMKIHIVCSFIYKIRVPAGSRP